MATTSNSTFGTTEAARNTYFTRVVPFLNLADTKTRFRILAGSLDPLNHRYSNPTNHWRQHWWLANAETVVYSWYIFRYESTTGVLGDPCGVIRAQILHP